jgi:hypothetical protein
MGCVIRRNVLAFPETATNMLPNFKIVIGGVLIFMLLFAVTGAGVVTPQIYTRIGAMPEIGRPMMQHVFADEAGLAQPHRSDELRLRELAALAAIPEPQAAPDLGEQSAVEEADDEKSEAAAEPIVATIAAVSARTAAPPPEGGDSVTVPPRSLNAGSEPDAAAAAPSRPPGLTAAFAAGSVTDVDRVRPPANELPQARPAARQDAPDADLAKAASARGRERTPSASSEAPKRNHRAAAHARKRLAAARRVHPATPAPTPNPAYNFFGQTSFQSHF